MYTYIFVGFKKNSSQKNVSSESSTISTIKKLHKITDYIQPANKSYENFIFSYSVYINLGQSYQNWQHLSFYRVLFNFDQ